MILLAIVLVLQVIILLKKDSTGDILEENVRLVNTRLTSIQQTTSEQFVSMNRMLNDNMGSLQTATTTNIREMSKDVQTDLLSVQKEVYGKLTELIRTNAEGQEHILSSIQHHLDKIEDRTGQHLSAIQDDVNRKLDVSLNERLDKSFDRIASQLSELYKSLGELGEMSTGILSLNKTLSNVKTRGTWGELQLDKILEDTMAPGQYEKNVHVRRGSKDVVEFAIKIPSKEDKDDYIYLPVDSKFPADRYNAVVDASSYGSKEDIQKAVNALEASIKEQARLIRDKYILPPATTDFAIMFLPTESMYAEVLKIPGLAEFCQNRYRVVISGPATITALLCSLQIGFRNLVLAKKTEEVRRLLEAVKTQYMRLDDQVDKMRKNLDLAIKNNDGLKNRVVQIQKAMANIHQLDTEEEADHVLQIETEE